MHRPVPSLRRTFARLRVVFTNRKQSPEERILAEPQAHQAAEAVEALAQIGRGAVRPDGDLLRGADHRSARSSVVSVSTLAPSTRTPPGMTSVSRNGFQTRADSVTPASITIIA